MPQETEIMNKHNKKLFSFSIIFNPRGTVTSFLLTWITMGMGKSTLKISHSVSEIS